MFSSYHIYNLTYRLRALRISLCTLLVQIYLSDLHARPMCFGSTWQRKRLFTKERLRSCVGRNLTGSPSLCTTTLVYIFCLFL